jgi:hypothetical protein
MANRICFVELPVGTTGPAKTFYTDAFGFAMTDFGPTYSCTIDRRGRSRASSRCQRSFARATACHSSRIARSN